jgi:DNA-binding transcriptional MerR regulator
MEKLLPQIPAKRYFTIGEVSELCGVKPHVLRYWEQEFTQLRPMKRRGNRRYYQHHEVLMIRRIRELLYEHGFTISGARNRLQELGLSPRGRGRIVPATEALVALPEAAPDELDPWVDGGEDDDADPDFQDSVPTEALPLAERAIARAADSPASEALHQLVLLRRELFEIRDLLSPSW